MALGAVDAAKGPGTEGAFMLARWGASGEGESAYVALAGIR